ncbi:MULTISPECIES: MFS transporter [unclassified Haladaptatus]|uniref:MFS transporter n=1 Tax=unclassified Haladaptatus TaxID=2622732 RepID=UPI0023E8709E|nr:MULTISPECIES: MFS transporter [unclassified Haladaptatus]
MAENLRPDRVPWRSRTVQVVLLSTLLAPLGVPLVAPALPVIRDAFAVTDARASLVVSAYFVVGIVLSPFIGLLADRLGRKRVLVTSLLAFGVTGGAIYFAPSFEWVLALRAIQGTAAAGLFVATVTLIGDTFEGTQRNAVLGMNIAVLSAGAALFPLVGGILVSFGWNVPFLACLLAIPVGLFALFALEEPALVREARGVAYIRRALSVVTGPNTLFLYGAAFATELLLFGAILTVLPFLLTAQYGLAPVFIGGIIVAAEVGSIVVSTQNGRLARHISNRLLVAGGFACFGVGLVVAWLAPSALVVALGAVVVGAGLGLSMPAVDAAISDLVTGEYRAGALSLRNSTTFLGRATGPALFAGLAAVTGYPLLLLGAGLVSLTLALLIGVALRSSLDRAGTPPEKPDEAV